MADRQRVFDADTHFQSATESIVDYLDKAMLARLPSLERALGRKQMLGAWRPSLTGQPCFPTLAPHERALPGYGPFRRGRHARRRPA